MRTQDLVSEHRQRAWDALEAVRHNPKVEQWLVEADALHGARRRARWTRWAAAASVAVAAVGIAAFAYLHFSFTRYETRVGEQRDVLLEDGSRITLNTNTAIAVRYSGNHRYIQLTRGEALFSVQHDVNRPFDVVASGVLTRALGTEFNVDVRATNVTVSVLEGAVRVAQVASDSQGTAEPAEPLDSLIPAALGKGQALEFMPQEHCVRGEKADRRRIDAWRARKLEFIDTPLSQAVDEFNRYSTLRVVVGSPELGDVRVSGVFRIGDAESFLFSLREALNIETHNAQDSVVLIRTTP
jgi:transmembrane sensor